MGLDRHFARLRQGLGHCLGHWVLYLRLALNRLGDRLMELGLGRRGWRHLHARRFNRTRGLLRMIDHHPRRLTA
jgi:hypothetical protein